MIHQTTTHMYFNV